MKHCRAHQLMFPLILLYCCSLTAQEWKQLPSLPDHEGFAGAFAGVSNGAVIFAGGANFPDRKPWEGGQKVWYDSVFVLEKPNGEWIQAGKLPSQLGYGVSVSHSSGLVCVGGSNKERHFSDAFKLQWKDGRLIQSDLPRLPSPLANSCGALVGEELYIVGGQEKPDSRVALKACWMLDLSNAHSSWTEIEPLPGPGRILSMAASTQGYFWIAGGAELSSSQENKIERRYLKDAYRFSKHQGWTRLDDMPVASVGAPSPAPLDDSGFLVLGGDDGSQAGILPDQHRGFNSVILRYDITRGSWSHVGSLKAPRVTTPCLLWNSNWIIPSGEIRPGIRSPQVWGSTLNTLN